MSFGCCDTRARLAEVVVVVVVVVGWESRLVAGSWAAVDNWDSAGSLVAGGSLVAVGN